MNRRFSLFPREQVRLRNSVKEFRGQILGFRVKQGMRNWKIQGDSVSSMAAVLSMLCVEEIEDPPVLIKTTVVVSSKCN